MELDNVTTENLDDFLSKFDIKNYSDQNTIESLRSVIKNNRTHRSRGYFGFVIDIPKTDNVVKYVNICNPYAGNPILDRMCNDCMKGDLVYKIPYSLTDKTIILAPNKIIEALIGKIMGDIHNGFVKTKNFYFEPYKVHDTLFYIIMEKLFQNTKIIDIKNFLYLLTQIMCSISIGQQDKKFVHGHLVTENIMIRPYTENKIRCYELDNSTFLYTYFDYDNVIIDYSFSRCETSKNILTPRTIQHFDILDWFQYNEYIDPYTFIKYLMYQLNIINNTTVTKLSNLIGDEATKIMHSIVKYFLNTDDDIFEKMKNLSEIYWPDVPKLLNSGLRLSNATEIFSRIGTELLPEIFPEVVEDTPSSILEILKVNRFYISKVKVDFPDYQFIPFRPVSAPYFNRKIVTDSGLLTNIDDCITIRLITNLDDIDPSKIVRREKVDYNYTLPRSVEKGLNDFNKQHIFIATINQEIGKIKSYFFDFECCMINIRDFFANTRFRSGVVINAVFFNITSNMYPIGYFKSGSIVFDEPIPNGYIDDYGVIGVDRDGKLKIDVYDNRHNYEKVMSCGAYLMKNGVQQFDDAKIREVDSTNIYRYLSKNVRGSLLEKLPNNKYIRSASHIKPGELCHAGNSNPRTIIGIDYDDIVYLIKIEGRDDRGTGMDFIQLCQLCEVLRFRDAINLDGGGSSRISWKNPASTDIHIGGSKLDSYPVGSVLAYCKK